MNLSSGQRGVILFVRDVSTGELLSRARVTEESAASTKLVHSGDWVLAVAKGRAAMVPGIAPPRYELFTACVVVDHELCSMTKEEFL
jgi:hypothetical protein